MNVQLAEGPPQGRKNINIVFGKKKIKMADDTEGFLNRLFFLYKCVYISIFRNSVETLESFRLPERPSRGKAADPVVKSIKANE